MPSEVEGAAAAAPETAKPEDAKAENVKGEDVKMEDAVKEEKGEEKVDATEEQEKGEGDPEATDKAQEPEDAPGQPEPSEPPPPPPPTELVDAPEDLRARVKVDEVCLDISGATPNVMPSADGRMLFSLCDGGLQYLLAGVKSTVGLKAGCYMFEVRIVEMLNPYEGRGGRDGQGGARTPQPRQQVRVGFSIAGTSPLLDEEAGKFYFDSDGHIVNGSNYSRVASRFGRDQCVALVLNLGDDALAKTASLFVDGRRASNPQPIPEDMIGQVLYPTITFKNVTLQVNFGLSPKMALPFKCRMLKDASADDVVLTKVAPADGTKREVLVPIGLPDQGVFDWLDQFLEANPNFTELSDRKVLEWASRSGLSRARGYDHHASNDKPGMHFNVPMVDDLSIQKTLSAIVPALRRDFVVMELRDNLVAAERKKLLSRFPAVDFKRVAVVAIGEPTKEYKERVQTLMLTEKKKENEDKEREKRRRQEEEDWHRAKQGRYDRGRQQDEEKEDPAVEKEEPKDEVKDEAKDEVKEEQKEGNEEAQDVAKDETKDGEKAVELTPEEAALWYRKSNVPDLTHKSLANSYADFTLPAQDEGFDEVRYVWQEAAKCSEVLKEWVLEKKKTQKVENLEPSDWFKEKWDAWSAQLSEWKRKQNESKDALRRKGPNKNLDKKVDGEEKKDGEDGNEDGKKEEDDGDKSGELDEDDIDPFTHENLDDMGNGKPLYGNFVYEDWTLLSTRYEMHLLVHAFRRDLNDPDRQSFHESHLSFYYGKYYKKTFNIKQFGVESLEDLVALIKDTISINAETSFIEVVLPEDVPLDKLLRYAEDHRRERQRCIDAGDETASLKFTRPAPAPPKGQSGYGKGSGGDDRGGRQHYDRRGDRGGGRNDRGSGGQQGGYSQRGGSNWGGDRGGYGGDSRGGYSDNRGGDSRSGRGGDRGSYKGDRGGYSGDRGGSGSGYQGGGSKGGSSKRGYQAPPGPPPSNYPPAKQPRYDTSRSGPPPPRGGDPRGSRAGGGGSRNTGGGGGGYGGGGSRGYR